MRKFLIILFSFLGMSWFASAQKNTINLNSNWYFRQADQEKVYAAEIPGTIHTDLLRQKLIPDPFFGENEQKVQWVEQKSWIYETLFDVHASELAKSSMELVFEGLDTYAQVYLNGKKYCRPTTCSVPGTSLLRVCSNKKTTV